MGMKNGEPATLPKCGEPMFLDYQWVEGHAYTVDSKLGVWHWQTTSPKGDIGWLRIGVACDVDDAEMMIADHAAHTPLDNKAYRWAVLPLMERPN